MKQIQIDEANRKKNKFARKSRRVNRKKYDGK